MSEKRIVIVPNITQGNMLQELGMAWRELPRTFPEHVLVLHRKHSFMEGVRGRAFELLAISEENPCPRKDSRSHKTCLTHLADQGFTGNLAAFLVYLKEERERILGSKSRYITIVTDPIFVSSPGAPRVRLVEFVCTRERKGPVAYLTIGDVPMSTLRHGGNQIFFKPLS